ncbi:lipopolysaccharide kinase InaA family protein [Methylotenera sp.]|uniref:lipopolysaccharide kinase InaA family protein n=1 Tax=Methylotenera sp. TaxID=2051956 RepID=UPI002ED7BD6E
MITTAAALKLKQFGISNPLITLADGTVLEVWDVVRVVPAKRLVCQGIWCGQLVYAKLFFGQGAAKYLARDKQGIELLLQANIATPPILFAGLSLDHQQHVLMLEAITSAKNAEVCWSELALDAPARIKLAEKLVLEVAAHHQAGLLQTDLYLKNFLLQMADSTDEQSARIFTLDGDGIRRLPRLFASGKQKQNLATLFSKMDALDDYRIPELYRLYCEHLGKQSSPLAEAEIWQLTQQVRRQVASSYADKKVFRTCTDVKVTKSFKSFVAVASTFDAKDFAVPTLDGALLDKNANFKNGNTCTVAKARLTDGDVVIKRYNIKGFWHGLSRALRMTRAAKSWANAYRLMISGILTPPPVALIEERWGCFRRRAYFVSAYVEAPDALQYFAQCISLQDKKAVAQNLAALFYKMYLLRFAHGDCKATNIKIVDGAPLLIDLDSMQAYSIHWLAAFWFKLQHIKDLKRLMKNWADDAEIQALLKQAFVQKYGEHGLSEQDNILIRAKIA